MVLRILGCFGDRVHRPEACMDPADTVVGSRTSAPQQVWRERLQRSPASCSLIKNPNSRYNKLTSQVYSSYAFVTVVGTRWLPRCDPTAALNRIPLSPIQALHL
jgi:hypothetical protein